MERAAALLVFGRGLTVEAGRYALTPAAAARVRAAADYVTAHPATDGRPPIRVVFSGGWADASEGAAPPPPGCREGDLMLAEAHRLGLRGDLHAESESRSTLENVLHTRALLQGYAPLGLVAQRDHLPRIRYLVRKVTGLCRDSLVDVPAPGPDGTAGTVPEPLLNLLVRASFLGIRDPDALLRRERLVVRVLRR